MRKKTEERQRWEQIIDRITDALGMPVDRRIREVVIALNVLGIHTTASCEGHTDPERPGAPYVEIALPEATQLHMQVSEARQAGEDERVFELAHKARATVLAGLRRLYELLERFYASHSVPYDVQLFLAHDDFGEAMIQSHGAAFQAVREPKLQRQRLEAYQEEMAVFAAFLKQLDEVR